MTDPAMTNPADLTIPQAAAALRSGTLTARDLTTAHLSRIAARADLHAFTHPNPQALAEADRADVLLTQPNPAAFCGIPFAVKDLIDAAGLPATSGSAVLAGRIAGHDADAVARLRAGGPSCWARLRPTNSPWSALTWPCPTRPRATRGTVPT